MSIIKEHIEFDPKDLISVSKIYQDNILYILGNSKATTKQPFKGEVVYLKENGDNNMSIEIKTDKVRMYEIKGVRALRYSDLPEEYVRGMPRIHMSKTGKELTLVFTKNEKIQVVFIRDGDMISEYDLVSLYKYIELAGDRLHKINHKNDTEKTEKKENEIVEWAGSETFEA